MSRSTPWQSRPCVFTPWCCVRPVRVLSPLGAELGRASLPPRDLRRIGRVDARIDACRGSSRHAVTAALAAACPPLAATALAAAPLAAAPSVAAVPRVPPPMVLAVAGARVTSSLVPLVACVG